MKESLDGSVGDEVMQIVGCDHCDGLHHLYHDMWCSITCNFCGAELPNPLHECEGEEECYYGTEKTLLELGRLWKDYVPPEEITQMVVVKRPKTLLNRYNHDRVLKVLFKFYDDGSIACEVLE